MRGILAYATVISLQFGTARSACIDINIPNPVRKIYSQNNTESNVIESKYNYTEYEYTQNGSKLISKAIPGGFTLEHTNNGQKTIFDWNNNPKNFFPLKIGNLFESFAFVTQPNGTKSNFRVKAKATGSEIIAINGCMYNVIKIDSIESYTNTSARYFTRYVQPETGITLRFFWTTPANGTTPERTGSGHVTRLE